MSSSPSSSSPPFPSLVLYHLCEKKFYDEAVQQKKAYYPPTFEQEKFTHTTSDHELLLPIANEFYKSIEGDFILLWIDQDKIKYEVKYEAPVPLPGFEENRVLEKHLIEKEKEKRFEITDTSLDQRSPVNLGTENGQENGSENGVSLQPGKVCLEQYEANPDALKCPHVYGPIELDTVFNVTPVVRNSDGSFERFEGLNSC